MPPVSTPSSASAGPGVAIAVIATWCKPDTEIAASRARPTSPVNSGSGSDGSGHCPGIATAPNLSASLPEAASARPRRIAATERASRRAVSLS